MHFPPQLLIQCIHLMIYLLCNQATSKLNTNRCKSPRLLERPCRQGFRVLKISGLIALGHFYGLDFWFSVFNLVLFRVWGLVTPNKTPKSITLPNHLIPDLILAKVLQRPTHYTCRALWNLVRFKLIS